jgi:hypothetical protein
MPLSFNSTSHGSIAFGFFNIDSDMLLLNNYFLFATDFCEHISKMANCGNKNNYESTWNVWYITDPNQIGDLMGAIYGIRHTGFIGELYQRFPFPENPADFKQKPEGNNTQDVVKTMIQTYATSIEIPFKFTKEQSIKIGDYEFDRDAFFELIKYVWQGGYPRWRDELRPDYVIEMKNTIQLNNHNFFEDIVFS